MTSDMVEDAGGMGLLASQAGDAQNSMRAVPAVVVVGDVAFDQERVRGVRERDAGKSPVVTPVAGPRRWDFDNHVINGDRARFVFGVIDFAGTLPGMGGVCSGAFIDIRAADVSAVAQAGAQGGSYFWCLGGV